MSEVVQPQQTPDFCDAHAHLADPRIFPSVDTIIHLSQTDGVSGILATAARLEEWDRIVALSHRDGIYGALGLHPFFVDQWSAAVPAMLQERLCANASICAVGEIGLDFYKGRAEVDLQREVFSSQLACAVSLDLPVAVHNRKSWPDFLGILRDFGDGKVRGLCHHFSAHSDIAGKVLSKGFYLSFCGPATRPDSRRLREAVRYAPLDRILTETDAPDLAPDPFRGSQSRPWHVRYVVKTIAEIKGLHPWQVSEAVAENFRRLLRV